MASSQAEVSLAVVSLLVLSTQPLVTDLLKFTSSVSQAHSQLINLFLSEASNARLLQRTMVADMINCRHLQNNLGLCRKMSPQMIFTHTSSASSAKFISSFEKMHNQSGQRNRLPDCRTKRRIKGHFVKEIRLPHSATPVFR